MRALMMILAMLAVLAMTSTPAAARPCLNLQQIKAKHPGQHPRYRSIEGRQCWYVGKTPAKSEFSLPPVMPTRAQKTNHAGEAPVPSTLAATVLASASASRRGEPAPDDGMDNVLATLCGGPCPDFRGMDLHNMQARLEAAHAAFMFLQAMR
jgi:hypothetical protein